MESWIQGVMQGAPISSMLLYISWVIFFYNLWALFCRRHAAQHLLVYPYLTFMMVSICVGCRTDTVGSILDDRLKDKILKPWKGVFCIHFCVCMCVCACRLQSTPFDPVPTYFGWGILGTWQRNAFIFEIFIFTLFILIFRFFLL